jgi:flagellar biosynthesis protein FlhB
MEDIIDQIGGKKGLKNMKIGIGGIDIISAALQAFLIFACVFLIYFWSYEFLVKNRQQTLISLCSTFCAYFFMAFLIFISGFVPMLGIKYWMPWLLYIISIYVAFTTIIYY